MKKNRCFYKQKTSTSNEHGFLTEFSVTWNSQMGLNYIDIQKTSTSGEPKYLIIFLNELANLSSNIKKIDTF